MAEIGIIEKLHAFHGGDAHNHDFKIDEINTFTKGVEVVGSAIIENPDGKILMVQSPKWRNKWMMPGGHIEPGETIEQGILREVGEETGLKLKSQGIIAYGELINSQDFVRPAHFIYFDLFCITDNTSVKLDNQELTDYVWVIPQDALKLDLAESYEKTIKDYLLYKFHI